MIDWITQTFGIEKTTTLGGIMGAILSLAFLEQKTGPIAKAFAIFGGWACANFLTPIAIDYFGLTVRWQGGLGFMLGLFGMLIIAAIVRALKALDLLKFIGAKLGGGDGN
jgi:hypothetical protein